MTVAKRGEHTGDEPLFTLEMLLDYLARYSFRIVCRPSRPVYFSRAVTLDEFAAMIPREEDENDRVCPILQLFGIIWPFSGAK